MEYKRAFLGVLAALLTTGSLAAGDLPKSDFNVVVGPLIKEAKAELAPSKEASVWVSFGSADLARLNAAGAPLGAAVAESGRAAIYKVSPSLLPELSAYMHERFKRCGGFFAHRSRAEAERDLSVPASAFGGSYTLDQQAVVKPLIARVKEAEIRGTIETLAAYHNRYYTADTGVQAARWVAGRWQALAAKLPGASVQLVSHADWPQPSVILTIPGSEKPDEIVVLGGHLDSINGWGDDAARAPGADDNASGIAVLTETLRVLADSGFKPRRTVQIMGYAAEEVGLRGSADIAAQYAQAGKKVVGVIQFDMSNFPGSGNGIFLLTDNVDPVLSDFVNQLIDVYVGVPRSTTQCGYACSDHASWTQNGYPSAMAFEATFDGMNHNLHTDHDSLANAGGNAEHSASFAKLAVAFAVELAKTAQGFQLASR